MCSSQVTFSMNKKKAPITAVPARSSRLPSNHLVGKDLSLHRVLWQTRVELLQQSLFKQSLPFFQRAEPFVYDSQRVADLGRIFVVSSCVAGNRSSTSDSTLQREHCIFFFVPPLSRLVFNTSAEFFCQDCMYIRIDQFLFLGPIQQIGHFCFDSIAIGRSVQHNGSIGLTLHF